MVKSGIKYLLVIVLVLGSVAVASAHPKRDYWHQFIEPDISDWPQEQSNWCGPATLQAAIDWVWDYHYGLPVHYSQQALWDFMRDHTCGDLGGQDAALPGTVGDGNNDVREMNIAYDFGVDPHAMAWTMNYYSPFHYHYWVYYDSVYEATRWLLWTVEQYAEPVFAAVYHGSHYVLVIGYHSDRSATDLNGPGTVYHVRIADPLRDPPSYWWVSYDTSSTPWTSYYFTRYTHSSDPDPSTGWYISPPDHWRNHWVTIERDAYPEYSPDWGMSLSGPIAHQPLTYLPDVKANWGGWSSSIIIRNNGGSAANASITFYADDGYPLETLIKENLASNATWTLDLSTGSFIGSAVVAASQDVAVVVRELC